MKEEINKKESIFLAKLADTASYSNRTELKNDVLDILAEGGVVLAALCTYRPYKYLHEHNIHSRRRIRVKRMVDNLITKGVVSLENERLVFTKTGLAGRKKQDFVQGNVFCKSDSWDGKFRIVVYDIPRLATKERYDFVKILRSGGFEPMQDSTYIYPHDCKNEIMDVVNFLDIAKFVTFIEAVDVSGKDNLVRLFKKRRII